MQAVYVKGCKGWTGINRPSCRTVTSQKYSYKQELHQAARHVIAYAQRSGKQTNVWAVSSVNKKKQFTVIKIKKQKKNTAAENCIKR